MLMPRFFNDYSLFDDIFDTVSSNSNMNCDIQEFDHNYVIDFELPGFKKENIKAELKNGYLVVSASRTDEDVSEGNYIRRERFMGTTTRSFYVGDNITQEDINAKYENGILTLTIPKKEKVQQVENKHYISID